MATRQTPNLTARIPALTPYESGDIMTVTSEYTIPATLAVNDVIEMGILPAGCIPVDFTLFTQAADSNGSPTLALDAGILSGNPFDALSVRTCGADFVAATTVARAGGIQRAVVATGFQATASVLDRSYGLKVGAGAATLVVGAKLRATLTFSACPYGIDAA